MCFLSPGLAAGCLMEEGGNELLTVQIVERHSVADNSKVNNGDNVADWLLKLLEFEGNDAQTGQSEKLLQEFKDF